MKASNLKPEEFSAWRLKHGMSIAACARRLGIATSSVNLYESGERDGRPVYVPITVCLAMSAIENNLEPYGEKDDSDTVHSSSNQPAGH